MIDEIIKRINALRIDLKKNDKRLQECENVKKLNKILEERANLYIQMKVMAEDLVSITKIKIEDI